MSEINPYHLDYTKKDEAKRFKSIISKNYTTLIKNDLFNINNLIYMDHSSHMFFEYGTLNPLTTVYHCDYIQGGLHNENYHLKKVLEHFKTHPYIINKENLNIEEIPYYNAECGRDKFIHIKVLPPQDKFIEMWNIVKDKDQCPSCRLKEYICNSYGDAVEYDLLNIKQFRKNEQLD